MAFTNINPYPAAAAAIDKQVVENIFLDDIINHDYSRNTKMALLVCMKALHNRIEDDEDYWAEATGDKEWEKAQKEARQKLARKLMDEFKAKRANRQKEEEEEEEVGEEQEEDDDEDDEEEDEESEESEEDFEEEYDDEEEETEGSEESEESGDEESDDGSDWDSLFLLVHNMPTENDEPKSTARKRSLPRDDTPCPPPRPQPAKRQKLDPSAASKPPMVQDSGEEEPKPVTRKRRPITQQDADTPATEVPFPKRQRIDPPVMVANANDEDREEEQTQTQTQTQEAKSSVPSEWLAPHREELENSQLPEPLRGILGRLPVNELHYEAQTFLLSLKYSDPTDDALAKAAIDMGLRFSKTAKSSEYKIVFEHIMKHPIQAVMYNVCKEDEAQHILFWEKVRNVTGKEIPPERIKERRQKRAKREAEAMARFNARKAAEEAKRESQMLKEKYVCQIGESSKLPLKEKVGRWLAEIVKAEKKQ
ncbi:hypothetical protein FPOAC2_12304 [Fusarium poae]|uniref:Uncharacterized protein n=1 Tax=Fusarium poae TaxID=36050 RepID=A0A1B8AFX3_FUSPO|nr:hypothetical protein FPOAC1_011972 [Fusarium poae]KAG8667150.1 hypothetical protein FPOAC1_011972 [Fusarium poae]OBS19387.1 hypothetical protein FPOA_11112 [Fusarium poae]